MQTKNRHLAVKGESCKIKKKKRSGILRSQPRQGLFVFADSGSPSLIVGVMKKASLGISNTTKWHHRFVRLTAAQVLREAGLGGGHWMCGL